MPAVRDRDQPLHKSLAHVGSPPPDGHMKALLLKGHRHALGGQPLGQHRHLRPVQGLEELVPVLWRRRLCLRSSPVCGLLGPIWGLVCPVLGCARGGQGRWQG